MRITTLRLTLLAPVLALAACSGSDSADQMDLPNSDVVDNGAQLLNDALANDVAPTPTPTPSPSATATKAASAGSADHDFTDPDQVQLDAESTGMTSRVDRSAPAPTPTDTGVPAQ